MTARLWKWFFERGSPHTAAALRIGVCLWYLLVLWDFYPAMPILFGHAGMFGTLERSPYPMEGFQYLLYSFNSPVDLQIWFWISVTVCVMGVLGMFSRLSLLGAFVSMILFRERGPFITFGADLVINCIAFWVLFLECGRVWSFDCLFKRKLGSAESNNPEQVDIELWPVKAVQIQVALIYLVTCLKKLPTAPWQNGSAVYYAIQVGSVLKGHAPSPVIYNHALLLFMNYGTLAVESALPLMLFYRPLRGWGMAAGFAMHTGIDLLMSIRFFSLAMYVGYLSFLEGPDWRRLIGWIAQRFATKPYRSR